MDKVKPTTLPGFLELLPKEQILFNKMMDIIRSNYEKFGFLPIDTPILEKSEVLLAKAGGETEKQIYRFAKGDTDLAMRFDLTVPLAKYVAQYYNQLSFPFRRYQIGKVYRGERPQRGRFREFYQCDIDIIGNGELSILNDAELPSVIYSIFNELGFENFTIRMNNRKVLNGFFESLNIKCKPSDVLRIVDKIDKIGKEKVKEELLLLEIDVNSIDKIISFLEIKGTNSEVICKLDALNIENEVFCIGLSEVKELVKCISYFGIPEKNYKIDLTIARGLDYYTGTVYETILNDYPQLGSVCSGGRYDNLSDYYTDKKMPGVGVSIGLSRLFFQLNDAEIIKSDSSSLTKVLIIPMIDDLKFPFEVATELRKSGVNTEIFFEKKNMKAKFTYADKLGIPFVIVIGEDEIKEGLLTLKDMNSSEQLKLSLQQVIEKIK